MPIWLRRFTFNKLKEFYEKQSQVSQNLQKPAKSKPPTGPSIKSPTYSTKVKK